MRRHVIIDHTGKVLHKFWLRQSAILVCMDLNTKRTDATTYYVGRA